MPTAGHKLRPRRDFVTRLGSNRVLDDVQLRRHGGTRWVKTGRLRGLTFAVGVLRRGGKFYGTDREGWWDSGLAPSLSRTRLRSHPLHRQVGRDHRPSRSARTAWERPSPRPATRSR